MSEKRKTSIIWNFFTANKHKKTAVCNLCKQMFSYKSTITNLRKHMARKHPFIDVTKPMDQSQIASNMSIAENDSILYEPSTSAEEETLKQICEKQEHITNSVPKKIGLNTKKRLDDSLMELFTIDFQPFSIVEDQGFCNFVNKLNSSYQLPNRKTITTLLLPALYEKTLNEAKVLMSDAKCVTLTTDCWTSFNMDNFIAVTVHFIDQDFCVKSALIACYSYTETDTSLNITEELRQIVMEWGLQDKINLAISDNSENIKKALRDELKWEHFDCFAHTINLIVQNGLYILHPLLEKIRLIVSHFKRNNHSNSLLINLQKQMEKQPKKLLQDVSTRWNSTYYMLERLVEMEDALRAAMALLDRDISVLTSDEWTIIKQMLTVLKPMESVTKIISAEHYVAASLIIIITKGLEEVYSEMKNRDFCELPLKVIDEFLSGINTRLGDLEYNNSLVISTFLDPRFKNIGFSKQETADRAKTMVTHLVANKIQDVLETESGPRMTEKLYDEEFLVFQCFDKRAAAFQPASTSTGSSRANIEVQCYLEDSLLERTEDPMKWWREHAYCYPHLSELVRESFVTTATSVPCERIFTKTGQLFCERRSRLSSDKVRELVFINANTNNTVCFNYLHFEIITK